MAAWLARVPAIVGTAQLYLPPDGTRQPRIMLRPLRRILAVSDEVRRRYERELHVPAGRLAVVRNAIRVPPRGQPADLPRSCGPGPRSTGLRGAHRRRGCIPRRDTRTCSRPPRRSPMPPSCSRATARFARSSRPVPRDLGVAAASSSSGSAPTFPRCSRRPISSCCRPCSRACRSRCSRRWRPNDRSWPPPSAAPTRPSPTEQLGTARPAAESRCARVGHPAAPLGPRVRAAARRGWARAGRARLLLRGDRPTSDASLRPGDGRSRCPRWRETPEQERNARLRRVDWRFLLPSPRPRRVLCRAAGILAEAVASIADEIVTESAGRDCDLVVAADPDAGTLAAASRGARAGGHLLYRVEPCASAARPRATRALLRGGLRRRDVLPPWPAAGDVPALLGSRGRAWRGGVRARARSAARRPRAPTHAAARTACARSPARPPRESDLARRAPRRPRVRQPRPAAWLREQWPHWKLGPTPATSRSSSQPADRAA